LTDKKIGFSLLAIMIVILAISAPSVDMNLGAVDAMIWMTVLATNRGPLHAGDVTTLFALIRNGYPVSTTTADRDLMFNSFVVSEVTVVVSVNRRVWTTFSMFPPPADGCGVQDCAAHWLMTVKCSGSPGSWVTPCQTLGNPSILPGESAYIFYFAWVHGSPPSEPNGMYIFQILVLGSLNGSTVSLSSASPMITMTT
jgi:hypothetical protein